MGMNNAAELCGFGRDGPALCATTNVGGGPGAVLIRLQAATLSHYEDASAA
jgi:hypothetical protein